MTTTSNMGADASREWQPIETMPRNAVGWAKQEVVVGWWVEIEGCRWWETDTDEMNDCATHWMPLPTPPAGETK